MKLKTALLIACSLLSLKTFGQKKTPNQTENLVLILIDGYRWQELFQGANYALLTNPKYNPGDSLQRMKKYWSDDLKERRKKLTPFIWNYIAEHGQLYGNRAEGNKVNVKNPYWISYPGRAEVLSGFVDKKVNSNGYGINTNPNVLEFINNQEGYKGKVVTFACWGATGRCLNKPNSEMLINVPWENIKADHLTDAEVLANEMQHYVPKIWGHIERLDANVYALAKSYIIASHPKVIYIDFGDTDEYAHHGNYEGYLNDIHNIDAMIGKLWKMMQADPFYKGNTTFFIVPDHGRGLGSEWTSHGSGTAHSDETWFMVMGPDTAPTGIMKENEQIYQTQFARTIARLLGFDYAPSNFKPGKEIESVIK